MNQILNAAATGLMCFALGTLTWTMLDRGYKWLAAGAAVWTVGFGIRLAGVVAIAATPDGEPIPEWVGVLLRDWAWTYRSVGALTLLAGIWIMQHQERPEQVVEALEEAVHNGTLADA